VGTWALKCGIPRIAKKSLIGARLASSSNPTGLCINELAVNIQNADKTEPIATSQIEARWVFFPKRSQPNTQMPKNVDSKKKANNPSIASEGPNTSPTYLE